MKIPDFELERWKTKRVLPGIIDLTETGVPEPLKVRDLLTEQHLDISLDYAPLYGSERLRELISGLYKNVTKENVLVTSSTSEGNMIAANVAINNGDEVVVQLPSFMQLPGLAEAIGTRIKPYYLEEKEGFELNVDKLRQAVSPKTKAIILNFPNNPTGRVLSEKQVKGICEIAREHDAWIIADEVYRGIEFDGPFSPSFAEYYDKAMVTSSLSKVWGLAGLRIGWLIGPKDVITDPASAYKEYTSLGCSLLSEYLAMRALEEDMRKKLIERGRRLVKEALGFYEGWMNTHKDIFSWIKPKFGVITLVKSKLKLTPSEFADRVFKKAKVAIVPCDVAFTRLDDYLRISYCHPQPILQKALKGIDTVIASL